MTLWERVRGWFNRLIVRYRANGGAYAEVCSDPPAAPSQAGPEPPSPTAPARPQPRSRGKRQRDIFLNTTAQAPARTSITPFPKPKQTKKPTFVESDHEVDDDDKWHFTREAVEESGTFYFRGALLDHLKVYFEVLARMKGASHDAFQLYSQVGATLLPMQSRLPYKEVPPFWKHRKLRPAFGAVAISLHHDDTEKVIYPRLAYFNRLFPAPIYVEAFVGDVYEVVHYFDLRHENNPRCPKWLHDNGFCDTFHVGVDVDGQVRVLKHSMTHYEKLRYRAGGGKGKKNLYTEYIPTKGWDYPPHLKSWHQYHCKRCQEYGWVAEPTVAAFAQVHFMSIANTTTAHETGVRIEVTNKTGLTAAFAVDMKRTAYFFKDRDVVLTPKGKRARIFHIVRPHPRTLRDGRVVPVHMHFAGLRKFRWAEYEVFLSVPGLHHEMVTTMDATLADLEAFKAANLDPGDMASTAQVGRFIRHLVHDEVEAANAVIKEAELSDRITK